MAKKIKYKFESFLDQYDLETLLKLKRGITSNFGEARDADGKLLTEPFADVFAVYTKFLQAIHDELFDESNETGFPKAQKYFEPLYGKEQHNPVKKLIVDLLNRRITEDMINMGIPNIVELESARFAWSEITFPKATSMSSLNHAEKEIKEIRDDIENGVSNPMEYADAIMCLLDSAARQDISLIEIIKAMRDKHEINRSRNWVENPDGSYQHEKHISRENLKAFEGRM